MRPQTYIVLIALLVLSTSGPIIAAVEQVSVRVNGMACPFCAYNIEKRVKTLDGVDHEAPFDVFLDKGIARFNWNLGVAFDPAAVREQIRKAGFTPSDIEIKATGRVRVEKMKEKESSGVLQLIDPQTKQVIRILPEKRANRIEIYQSMKMKAEEVGKNKKHFNVRVYGTVKEDEKGSWRLILKQWESHQYGMRP